MAASIHQNNIAEREHMLAAILTGQTCGEACWEAREDVCRCSCGGVNHGVLRDATGGVRPVRTRKINGHFYALARVEPHGGSASVVTMRPMEDLAKTIERAVLAAGVYKYWQLARSDTPIVYPCFLKTVSYAEVQRWPELAAWRQGLQPTDHSGFRPLVLWVHPDFAQYVPEGA